MAHDSLICYNANGEIETIVHFDAGHVPHLDDPAWNIPGGVTVLIDKAEYDTVPPPENVSGLAVWHEMNQLLLPKVVKASEIIGSLVQAKIDLREQQLADDAAARQKAAEKDAAFIKSLTPEQLDQYSKLRTKAEYADFLASLPEAKL